MRIDPQMNGQELTGVLPIFRWRSRDCDSVDASSVFKLPCSTTLPAEGFDEVSFSSDMSASSFRPPGQPNIEPSIRTSEYLCISPCCKVERDAYTANSHVATPLQAAPLDSS